ncbi:MAG: hypothetical protein U1F25_13605 [Rubrivivax sp.]
MDLRLSIDFYSAAAGTGSAVGSASKTVAAIDTDYVGFKRELLTGRIPTNALSARAYVWMASRGGSAGAAHFDCDDWQFELGAAPTGYAPRADELLAGVVGTSHVASGAITLGSVTDTSTTTGSTGSPGSSVRASFFAGPQVPTDAGDELDIFVLGRHEDTFWSSAAYAEVEVWLTSADTFGGTETEVTSVRRRFIASVPPAGATAYFDVGLRANYVPGAASKWLVCRYKISFFDSGGAAKQCAKDFSALAQWQVVRRRR